MGNIETTPEDKGQNREICKESERSIAVEKAEIEKEEKAGL